MTPPSWLEPARQGDFTKLPPNLSFEGSLLLTHQIIDGYRAARALGLGELRLFAEAALSKAERTGCWSGSATELWLALWSEQRRMREEHPRGERLMLLDGLAAELRHRLQLIDHDEKTHLLAFMKGNYSRKDRD